MALDFQAIVSDVKTERWYISSRVSLGRSADRGRFCKSKPDESKITR
jgi:hypothetical protein